MAQKWSVGVQVGNGTNCPTVFNAGGNGTGSKKELCLSYGLSVYRSTKNQSIWRARINWEPINFESSASFDERFVNSDVPTTRSDKTNAQQNNLIIAPGVFWETEVGQLKPRFGFEMPIRFFSPLIRESTTILLTNSIQGNQEVRERTVFENKLKDEAGSSIGLGAVVGFSYEIVKGLSIAAEFIPTISYKNHESTLTISNNQVSVRSTFIDGMQTGQESNSQNSTTQNDTGVKGFQFDQHQLQVLIVYEF